MVYPRDPRDSTFDAQPESGVGHRTVTPQIEVPFQRLCLEPVSTDARLEVCQGIFSLPSTDYLSVSFGSE